MWCAEGPLCVKVPSVPQVHSELEGWISECCCGLTNALECDDVVTIVKVRTSLSQGTALICSCFERCFDGRAVKIIVDGVDDRGVGHQEKVGAGGRSSVGSYHRCWGSECESRAVTT